jgi:hypothetical protein
MRKNIYQLLKERVCEPQKEAERLSKMFFKESLGGRSYQYTLCKYINEYAFRLLPFRGSSLSIEDLMSELGINRNKIIKIGELLTYCEFLAMVIDHSFKVIQRDRYAYMYAYKDSSKQAVIVDDSIKHILEMTNHEFYDTKDGGRIIVEKNAVAAQAACIIEDAETAIKIIEYNHIALKGDIEGKKQAVFSIHNSIEKMLSDSVLRKTQYNSLVDDTNFILNNMNIRHNNTDGKNQKEYAASLDDKDQEKWIDAAYNSMLMIILAREQLNIHEEVKRLKRPN